MNSYKQSLYNSIIRITANLIMVASIFIAMYFASRWHFLPSEGIFCLLFFGTIIPVWIISFLLTKWVRKIYPAEHESYIQLPHRGKQLVKWKVIESKTNIFPGRCDNSVWVSAK